MLPQKKLPVVVIPLFVRHHKEVNALDERNNGRDERPAEEKVKHPAKLPQVEPVDPKGADQKSQQRRNKPVTLKLFEVERHTLSRPAIGAKLGRLVKLFTASSAVNHFAIF